MKDSELEKKKVQQFWDRASCGEEAYAQGNSRKAQLENQARLRYELEPYLKPFARFEEGSGKSVLEIGVGMGADHLEWAKSNPARLVGVDLTPRAIQHTRDRFAIYGLGAEVQTADAEALPFEAKSFDLVYSWGVLHHTPNTEQAFREVLRVLKPGGIARLMIYHKYSMVGYMLWVRYGLLGMKPWTSFEEIYARHLESPGTKAYSLSDAKKLASGFSSVSVSSRLSFGDLLEGGVGQRHGGFFLAAAKSLFPRTFVKRFLPKHGLCLLIEARK